MTDREKYLQVRREAAATGVALLALIVFWLVAGFGLAGVEVEVAHLPLWAVAGTIGTWGFALVLVKILTACVFRDMSLEDDGHGRR